MSSLLRRAALLLLLLTLFSAAAGCAGTGPGPEETSPGSSAGMLREEPGSLVICDASEQSLKYTIIRGMSAGPKEIQAAVDLNKALRDRSPDGWKMSISDDFVAGVDKKAAVENDDPEILVGSTNRKESRDAIGALPENGYVIAAVGRKIVIAGSGELATLKAMELFIETYIEGTPSSSVEIPLPLNITGVIADSREPLAEGASLRLMSWNLGCAVGVAEDAVSVIETYRADIIALQECNAEIHTDVIGVFLKDFDYYSHVQEKHSGTTTYNYTPILYNTKLLTLVEAGVEWLDGRYTGTNTKSLCWAVFDEISTGRRFMMVNFHGAVCSSSYKGYESMSSDERSAIANNWRIDNVRQILDVRSRLTAKYGDLPMTVNGDCNFNENSTPYANLTAAGFADCEKTAEKIITTGYKTSYSYGTGIPGAGLSIDHIFGTGGVRFVSFDIIRLQKVATASDHTPIYTDFCPCGQ
ncbi:MAG: endonuclease/exonuclease/phosphatase family protein [Clostridia bacterium]|nr:endonuclease/exonuclease/phosphatase family protein [Clostridia bacterium]